MKMIYITTILLISMIVGLLAYSKYHKVNYSQVEVGFENGVDIKCYLADSIGKQVKGLSGFDDLEQDEGMLFAYDSSQVRSIWMRGMNFPIDVIWLDKDREIVKLSRGLLPDSFPKQFSSKEKIMYFIEVNSGFVDSNNIKVGQDVDFKGQSG